jgi:hypothetical protein
MVRIAKFLFGCLALLYAVLQLGRFLLGLFQGADTAYAQGALAGSFAGTLVGAAIALACFKSVFNS